MNISADEKRKIYVLKAITGGSPSVLLDEPTAVMNLGAHRNVETLLERVKVDRLDKLVAGMCMGEVVCLVLDELCTHKVLFN
ncbi:hypothetical protein Aduo_005400 [Ancylostoma duodenale]